MKNSQESSKYTVPSKVSRGSMKQRSSLKKSIKRTSTQAVAAATVAAPTDRPQSPGGGKQLKFQDWLKKRQELARERGNPSLTAIKGLAPQPLAPLAPQPVKNNNGFLTSLYGNIKAKQ